MMTTVIDSIETHKVVGRALDATEAVKVCRKEQPDVIILDLVLGKTMADEVLPQLRKVCPKAKVLVFSGNLELPAIRGVVAARVDGIVEKMASIRELRAALSALAEGQVYFGPFASEQIKELVRRQVPRAAPAVTLSAREKEVLGLLAEGFSSREIAQRLRISVNTVVNHRANLMRKAGVRRAAQLSLYAAQIGVINADSSGLPQATDR